MRPAPDVERLIAMSVALPRLDLETAAVEFAKLGFDAMEVHIAQVGPGMGQLRLSERHAEAAGMAVRSSGLQVSTFNVVGEPSFQPFGDVEARRETSRQLALHLRMAAAMGAPRILIWDGRLTAAGQLASAPELLSTCIAGGLEKCGLPDPPAVSVEFHPFTFALEQGRLSETARAVFDVGAGVCLDFCHVGVALGSGWPEALGEDVLGAVNHVHFSDTDCRTSELHFPPGDGVLNLNIIGDRLTGRGLAVAWDLFSWPAPREAVGRTFGAYRDFVNRCRTTGGQRR
jgi:sugar phosphate isomerase/epimerase